MIILGLTGSIAMGKSTAAALFRRLKVPVFCADQAVHRLLGPRGDAVAQVARAFPGVLRGQAIDRAALAQRVFANPAALLGLERILHPLVERDQNAFLKASARRGASLCVLDIPLLFESGFDRVCDRIAVVSAPAALQRARLLRRPGMDATRITATLGRQMPDAVKRRRADYVIPSGQGRALTWRVIVAIVSTLREVGRQRHAGRMSRRQAPVRRSPLRLTMRRPLA